MTLQARKAAIYFCSLIFIFALAECARAQGTNGTLSGLVTGASGTIANARITLKNLATQETMQALTDANGRYSVPGVADGNYELTVSADSAGSSTVNVTMSAGADKTMDVVLGSGGPSLSDLGFSAAQAQGSAQNQALLDKRSHMLKVHQRLGLIAAAPMIASVVTSVGAGGRSTSSTDRYLHMALGAATADLYFSSAYFALRAPRIEGTETRGQIRAHKILAWIHGPGMILTPILGGIAFSQRSNGERVHGIASAHGPVAIVTASAYAAAIISVSIKF
jgi:hypothetical protein